VAPVLATSISSGSPSLLRNCAEVARTDWFIRTSLTGSTRVFQGGYGFLTVFRRRTDRPFGGYRRRAGGDSIPPDEFPDLDRGASPGHRRFVLAARSLRDRVRETMNVDFTVGLVLALAALVYLAYAMLRPERF
jgi:K+-transporting ATPase KdpF subunit